MAHEDGIVVRLVKARAFGFLRATTGHEYFFHRTNMVQGPESFDELAEGDAVAFDTEHGAKGPRAVNVETRTT